jgi:8-oxo-dGTP pyrophosphatase MutT (NUDIX family)
MRSITTEDFKSAVSGRKPRPIGEYRFSSVLAPLVERNGELHLLYEIRADSLRRQPGEISFPGGKMEPGESPRECAVRETAEELGMSAERVNVIGELDYIHTYSNFTLYCFLGLLADGSFDGTTINPAEVKETFLAPISFFMRQEPEVYRLSVEARADADFPYEKIGVDGAYHWRSGNATVPVYLYEGRPIWGLTARLTWNLIRVLKESLRDGRPSR